MEDIPISGSISITTTVHDELVVVEIAGDIDLYSSRQLHEALTDAVMTADPPSVIIDLRAVEFIDSTALGVFVSAFKQVQARQGALRIRAVPPDLSRAFALTGLDKLMLMSGDP